MKRNWAESQTDGRTEDTAKKPKGKGERQLYVVLENAQLEVGKASLWPISPYQFIYFSIFEVGQNFELLASDKHAGFLKKNKKDPGDYRPDITHQVDSVSGRLE